MVTIPIMNRKYLVPKSLSTKENIPTSNKNITVYSPKKANLAVERTF